VSQASLASEKLLAQISAKLEELISRHERLQKEHNTLRAKEADWLGERARLMEKNEIAKARIEAMIDRLTQLESSS